MPNYGGGRMTVNYAAGDYAYRVGNYAAGGIFSSIGRAIGGIVRTVAPAIIPGPVGGLIGQAGNILAGGSRSTTNLPALPPSLQTMAVKPQVRSFTGINVGGEQGITVGRRNIQEVYVDGNTGQAVAVRKKSRRMNVANPRALRRALRRVSGFGKLARRAKRDIGRAASAVGVKRGGRGGSPGVITRSEAARALRR